MQEKLLELLSARTGHFLLESGHHGDLWLDLESLFLNPRVVQPLVAELAREIAALRVDAICGPLVEGAFVAIFIACELGIDFTYTERFALPTSDGLFPAGYRLPAPQRSRVLGKRVVIVNDVINAGSAVKGTFTALQGCGAQVVGIGSLLLLGKAASEFASAHGLTLATLATHDNRLWRTADCPLCASGIPLEDLGGFQAAFS